MELHLQMAFRIRKRLLKNTVPWNSKEILHMRKQWIPGPFLSPREKGLGNEARYALASYPVPFHGGKEKGLVSTVCACARFVREFAMNIISDVQTWAETKRDVLCLVNTFCPIFLVLVSPCSPSGKVDTAKHILFPWYPVGRHIPTLILSQDCWGCSFFDIISRQPKLA